MTDQSFRIGAVCALTQQKREFFRLAGLKPDQQLQRRAWVTTCLHVWRQADAFQRGGAVIISMIPEKLCTICSNTIQFTSGCQECHALSEICAIGVARQQSELTHYKFRND